MRSENTTSSETPRTQYTRSLKKRLKSLEKRLPRLEGAQAILEEELKKLKNGSKEQKLAIAELRKEKDSIAIEVRIREELERRGD
jgi:peptidoglycan hydrolase CwlO-like protein